MAMSAQPSALVISERRRPDLEVHISRHPDGHSWRFNSSVSGPKIPKTVVAWDLPNQLAPSDLVTQSLDQFCSDKVSNEQRGDLLRGAGKSFFKAAPENFTKAYWKLVDDGCPPGTISITSEEPSFPWELIVPHRGRPDGSAEVRPPLGVESVVGRWVHASSLPAPQDCTLQDSYVIVPTYSNPLKFASVEGEYVTKHFNGTPIHPATYDMLTKTLRARAVSLLHFACHGQTDPKKGQFIILDNKEEMYAASASGSEEFQAAFFSRPLVFLNACEVGRQVPTLAGPQGFAPAFAELGACAVIAALWSVEDDVAHDVAQSIYDSIDREGDCSVAAVLQKLRARSYTKLKQSAKDSYAAYCFYGDPLLIVRKKCSPPSAPKAEAQ
jgi:hypothetical protein